MLELVESSYFCERISNNIIFTVSLESKNKPRYISFPSQRAYVYIVELHLLIAGCDSGDQINNMYTCTHDIVNLVNIIV